MTPQAYARAWEKRARNYGPAMKREFKAIGDLAHSVANRLITQEIYSKPEDTYPSGKPKWRRTNRLAVSEQPPQVSDDGTVITLVNTAVYAHRRHEANKPGFPYTVAPQRTAHWRDDMLLILDCEIPERIHRLSLRVLQEH